MAINEDEPPAKFHRSSFCGTNNCVEVAAPTPGVILVRDTKDSRPDAPTLSFTTAEWNAFVSGVHAGEFSAESLLQRT